MWYNKNMKFVDLKKHIISKNLYCCYNLFGDDNFLLNSAENMFFNYVAQNVELNKTVLSADNFDIKTLPAILNSISFMGGTKVTYLRLDDDQKSKDVLAVLKTYSKSPNTQNILIITSPAAITDSVEAFNKTANCFELVDCNRLTEQYVYGWINSELKGKNATMDTQAKQLLVSYTNGYLSRIAMEIDKLMAYCGEKTIMPDDVKLLVQKELEYKVFELTESLGEANSKKTFEILDDMMSDKKVAPSVLPLIQSAFRRMFFSAITPKTNAEIATELGVKEFAVKKAKDSAKMFTKIELKQIVDICNDLDYKIKSSQIDYKNAVYYLVSFILTNNKKTSQN